VLLERGAFTSGNAAAVADTLVAFAVGLVPFSLYLFSLRAFYSHLDTSTPFLINCGENAVNIALAFPLYAWLGVPGLALSFSLAYLVAAAVTLVVVQRRLRAVDVRAVSGTLVRTGAVGAVVGAVAWALGEAIGWSSTGAALLALLVGGIAGIGVYVGLSSLARVEEVGALLALAPWRRGAAGRPGV
jgi:putative peptidoglycan lipid II flippase